MLSCRCAADEARHPARPASYVSGLVEFEPWEVCRPAYGGTDSCLTPFIKLHPLIDSTLFRIGNGKQLNAFFSLYLMSLYGLNRRPRGYSPPRIAVDSARRAAGTTSQHSSLRAKHALHTDESLRAASSPATSPFRRKCNTISNHTTL